MCSIHKAKIFEMKVYSPLSLNESAPHFSGFNNPSFGDHNKNISYVHGTRAATAGERRPSEWLKEFVKRPQGGAESGQP